MKETRSFEVKERVTNTFLKTVSAYANFGDGIIRFGITDDGKFVGIEDAGNACLDIENRINDSISALLKMLGWRILQGFQSLFHFLKKRCFHRLLREYPTDSLL